jgi:glutaredoxin-like YruB-family protein
MIDGMVTVYTTTYCPYCKIAKSYFDKHHISYREVNVEYDDEALADMVRKSGQMSVPVIDVDGAIVVGFDRSHLANLLGIEEQ